MPRRAPNVSLAPSIMPLGSSTRPWSRGERASGRTDAALGRAFIQCRGVRRRVLRMQALLTLARAGVRAWPVSPPAWLAAERGRAVLWLPVLMGAGVLTYFALRHEPPPWV